MIYIGQRLFLPVIVLVKIPYKTNDKLSVITLSSIYFQTFINDLMIYKLTNLPNFIFEINKFESKILCFENEIFSHVSICKHELGLDYLKAKIKLFKKILSRQPGR
jgi:hypothetical protein